MSNSSINTPTVHPAQSLLAPSKTAKDPAGGSTNKQPPDAVLMAYMYIFDSVLIKNDTAQRQAKEIQGNALEQNNLISLENAFSFVECASTKALKAYLDNHETDFPSDVKTWVGSVVNGKVHIDWCSGTKKFTYKVEMNVLSKVNTKNQYVSAERELVESKLTLIKQSAQIQENDLNTTVNEASESIQEDSSLMNMLMQLTQQIARI